MSVRKPDQNSYWDWRYAVEQELSKSNRWECNDQPPKELVLVSVIEIGADEVSVERDDTLVLHFSKDPPLEGALRLAGLSANDISLARESSGVYVTLWWD